MEVYLTKSQSGFVPADIPSQEWANKIKHGEVIHADFKRVRNYQFLRKWFALLNVGFDNWEPGEIDSKYGVPEKNFERFRADIVILCGYYDNVVRLDGSVRIEPRSVSFSRMTEEEFSELYNKTINVLLKHVYDANMTAKALDNIVNAYMSFA